MWKRIFAVLAIACSAPILAVVLGAPIGKAGRGEVAGEWQATAFEVDGVAQSEPEPLRIVIKGDELTIHLSHGPAMKSKFKADAGKAPAAIDLTPDYGVFAGRVCAGIYEVDKTGCVSA